MRLARSEGLGAMADRLRTRLARRIQPANQPLLVPMSIFERAAEWSASSWDLPAPLPRPEGQPLSVAWICTPPPPGSGGHTTIFRMVRALERAGHRCTIYIQDDHGWSIDQHRRAVRDWWPWVTAPVEEFDHALPDHDAFFATSWTTAWHLLAVQSRGARAYFVQDFEPSFYPAGSDYLLAEATYRLPYAMVTAGGWLSSTLAERYGAWTQHFEFGADVDHYRLTADQPRRGICFYSRPETPRRAHELGIAALELFGRRHPEVPISTFGQSPGKIGVPTTHRGLLPPAELNQLYNSCVAGLVLSATNASLVPHEMLASGCVPVVNDAPNNREVLGAGKVSYTAATPHQLAASLSELVTSSPAEVESRARDVAASVSLEGWSRGERQFTEAVARIVMAAAGTTNS